MVRTQVRFTERQLDTLRELSAATGRPVAELVRLGVELYLSSQHRPSRKEQIGRALRALGRFSSGRNDVSVRHDRYLAEAFGE
jgi:hypothetical protein